MAADLSNLNLELAQNMESLTEQIQEVLSLIFKGFYKGQLKFIEEAKQKTKEIDTLLGKVQKFVTTDPSLKTEEIASAASILSNYQKIVFDLEKLSQQTETKNKEGILFTEKAVTELEELFRGIRNLFLHLNDIVLTRNAVLVDYVLKEKKRYKQLARQFAVEHEERLIKGICLARSSSIYLYMMDALEDILWHLQAIIDELKE